MTKRKSKEAVEKATAAAVAAVETWLRQRGCR